MVIGFLETDQQLKKPPIGCVRHTNVSVVKQEPPRECLVVLRWCDWNAEHIFIRRILTIANPNNVHMHFIYSLLSNADVSLE